MLGVVHRPKNPVRFREREPYDPPGNIEKTSTPPRTHDSICIHFICISAAIVSIPSHKFCNRMFSFDECWLLS
jgi:hypothetical protein